LVLLGNIALRARKKTAPRRPMTLSFQLVHDLTVATRNSRDFKWAGVEVFDSFV
jgi:hypothetical protein